MRVLKKILATWLLLGCAVCAQAQMIVPPSAHSNTLPGMVIQVFRGADVETDHFEVEICPTRDDCTRNRFVPLSKYYVRGYRVHAYEVLIEPRSGRPITVVIYLMPTF